MGAMNFFPEAIVSDANFCTVHVKVIKQKKLYSDWLRIRGLFPLARTLLKATGEFNRMSIRLKWIFFRMVFTK